MKILRLIVSLLAAAALRASADFQSAQIASGNAMPQYPGGLTLSGITRGRAALEVCHPDQPWPARADRRHAGI